MQQDFFIQFNPLYLPMRDNNYQIPCTLAYLIKIT